MIYNQCFATKGVDPQAKRRLQFASIRNAQELPLLEAKRSYPLQALEDPPDSLTEKRR